MFKKEQSIKIGEYQALRSLAPTASLSDIVCLANYETCSDIMLCEEVLDYLSANAPDISTTLQKRSFIRWYGSNKRILKKLVLVTPAFALAMHGITSGLSLALFGSPAIVAYAAGNAVSTSFFGGKGAILLHMLVVGFITLVVCSFLKFTGRGDTIPLVVFVGGAVILYEVIGLFNDIYSAIKTLMQM